MEGRLAFFLCGVAINLIPLRVARTVAALLAHDVAGRQAGRPWAIQSDVLVIPDGDVSSVAAGWVYLAEDCSRKTRKVSKTNVHYLPSEASANQKEILLWRFWRLALTSQVAPPFAFGQIHLSSRTYHALPTSMARRRESPSPTRRASAWPKPLPRPPPAVKALPLGKAAPHASSWSPRHERTLRSPDRPPSHVRDRSGPLVKEPLPLPSQWP